MEWKHCWGSSQMLRLEKLAEVGCILGARRAKD